ncbi:MAG: hypothetical protein O2971_10100 [Proteobacteria bacterium]|nr:hypothetical protein [Pseudomonadota bacterium]
MKSIVSILISVCFALFASGSFAKKGGEDSDAVTICHKPDTPAEQVLQVPEAAVDGHLRHGDYEIDGEGEPPEAAREKDVGVSCEDAQPE